MWANMERFYTIVQRKNVGLNKTEKKVVSLLLENSEYTSEELAAKIGVTTNHRAGMYLFAEEKNYRKSWFKA